MTSQTFFGTLPTHWKVFRIKHLNPHQLNIVQTGPFGEQLHASDYAPEGIPLILIKHVQNLRILHKDLPLVPIEKANQLQLYKLKIGDFVFSRVGSVGRIALVSEAEDGWLISGQMLRLRVNSPSIFPHFLMYALISEPVVYHLSLNTVGVTRDSINTEILQNTIIPLPPFEIQKSIAHFLDRKTAAIDTLIAKKQRLIQLLEEKRTALINQAVTKGLNPNAPMKDSGIPWIGEIPEHWEVAPLYSHYDFKLGKMLDARRITGKHLAPYLRNVDVQWDFINVDNLPEMDFEPHERKHFLLEAGDLLICEGGEAGRTAMWRGELAECFYQKALHRLRPQRNERDYPRFLYYVMFNAVKLGVFIAGSNSNIIQHLTAEKLKIYRFPFPRFEEQIEIVDYLDTQSSRINKLIIKTELMLEKLQEYRRSLITAAVTGKLDIHNLNQEA